MSFPTQLQQFQAVDKYSRWNYNLNRRETWEETVLRAVDYLREIAPNLPLELFDEIFYGIMNLEVMPSMRLLAMSGEATRRNGITAYNCAFLGVDSIEAFAEAMYISMSGCGVGFSVERKYVDQLPELPLEIYLNHDEDVFLIPDDAEGWYAAIYHIFARLFEGNIPVFDYSLIRPNGAVLKTKGGRASGPEILKKTIQFIVETFDYAISEGWLRLQPIHVHDMMCAIGQAAVSGGVRRTAMISLFDIDDDEMRRAKHGTYNNFRWMANNSAVWPEDLTQAQFIQHMGDMFAGHNGEPGIFNLNAARSSAPERRDASLIAGLNPCGEIALRNMQFCNLTSVIARANDTIEDLKRKIRLATIIGTIQSSITNFPLLRPEWKLNCEEERLLGVDISGQMDCHLLSNSNGVTSMVIRAELKKYAIEVNKEYAALLGINESTAITTVKPSGNTSILVDSSAGMHPRWSEFYIRRVRLSTSSPIFAMLQDQGVPMVPENGQEWPNVDTVVLSFPVASPRGAITRTKLSALDMLEYWKENKCWYTEHNPSATIYYRDNEIMDIVKWLWTNRDFIGGLSFLPINGGKYNNAPLEEITIEEYLNFDHFEIDWSQLSKYEQEDYTETSQLLACSGDKCLYVTA